MRARSAASLAGSVIAASVPLRMPQDTGGKRYAAGMPAERVSSDQPVVSVRHDGLPLPHQAGVVVAVNDRPNRQRLEVFDGADGAGVANHPRHMLGVQADEVGFTLGVVTGVPHCIGRAAAAATVVIHRDGMRGEDACKISHRSPPCGARLTAQRSLPVRTSSHRPAHAFAGRMRFRAGHESVRSWCCFLVVGGHSSGHTGGVEEVAQVAVADAARFGTAFWAGHVESGRQPGGHWSASANRPASNSASAYCRNAARYPSSRSLKSIA